MEKITQDQWLVFDRNYWEKHKQFPDLRYGQYFCSTFIIHNPDLFYRHDDVKNIIDFIFANYVE